MSSRSSFRRGLTPLLLLSATYLPAQPPSMPLQLPPSMITDGNPDLAKVQQALADTNRGREDDDFVNFWRCHARQEALSAILSSMRVWANREAEIAAEREQVQAHERLGNHDRARLLQKALAEKQQRLAKLRRDGLARSTIARQIGGALLAPFFTDLATTPNHKPRGITPVEAKTVRNEYRALPFERLKDRVVERMTKPGLPDTVRQAAVDLNACLHQVTEALYRQDVEGAQKVCVAVSAWVLDPAQPLPTSSPVPSR